MTILRIEHPVLDFDGWKRAFDSDPAGRQEAGVRRYRILRDTSAPDLVTIDLELDSRSEAEAMLGRLRQVWTRVDGTLVVDPKARILELVEGRDL